MYVDNLRYKKIIVGKLIMKKYSPIKNYTGILIRIDDIAENMNWKLMQQCEKLFNKYDIKPLLGVIPNNQDNNMAGVIM